jgi:hypothetical protein
MKKLTFYLIKKQNIIKALILFVMFLVISLFTFGEAKAQRHLRYYEKIQYEVSFEKWKKDQPKKRLDAAKYAVKHGKEKAKEEEDSQKLNEKINLYYQKIKK